MILFKNGCARWLVLLLVKVSVIIQVIVAENTKLKLNGVPESSVSAELALSLRRQLMRNNYDYMTSSAEGDGVPGPAPHRAPPPPHSAELAPRPMRRSHSKSKWPRQGGSAELALSLRRQLMANNDDYIASPAEGDKVSGNLTLRRPPRFANLASRINEVYIGRAQHTIPPDAFNNSRSYAPSKKDLLYYMDDKFLSRRVGAGDEVLSDTEGKEEKTPPLTNAQGKKEIDPSINGTTGKEPAKYAEITDGATDAATDVPEDMEEESSEATSTSKYKLLKIKTHQLSRRFGRPVYRRILQEEDEKGVALINLSDGPFSDFHLPSPRRHRDSDELRPPYVSPEDLKTDVPSEADI